MRYGANTGRPTTVIPRASKPSNTKGKQTYVGIALTTGSNVASGLTVG